MNEDFKDLLDNHNSLYENKTRDRNVNIISSDPKSFQQKSNKSASMYELIEMIDKIVTLTMPNTKFIPDEGKVTELDSMSNFDCSIITYKIIERIPKKEIKPRVRETIIEKDKLNESRIGEVYGQKFKCLIQFNVFASVYKEAEEVMEKFEELIITYAGFFKENGVAEIFFEKHLTDDYYAKLRETLSIRNLIYYVEIEKLTVIFKEKIKEIEILAQKKEEN